MEAARFRIEKPTVWEWTVMDVQLWYEVAIPMTYYRQGQEAARSSRENVKQQLGQSAPNPGR